MNANEHLIEQNELAADLWDAEQCARAEAHKSAKATNRYSAFYAVSYKMGLNPKDRTAVLIAISLFFGRPVTSRKQLSDKELDGVVSAIEWRRLTW